MEMPPRERCFQRVFKFPTFSPDLLEEVIRLCLKRFPGLKEINYKFRGDFAGSQYVDKCSDFTVIKRAFQKWSGASGETWAKIEAELGIFSKEHNGLDLTRPHLSISLIRAPWNKMSAFELRIYASDFDKREVFSLDSQLTAKYQLIEPELKVYGLGHSLEVLAVCVDMRGFSDFCEDARIESPYVSSVISTFFEAAKIAFDYYRPELHKNLGDGVLAVWEIQDNDRESALTTCITGLGRIQRQYESLQKHPLFQHGRECPQRS